MAGRVAALKGGSLVPVSYGVARELEQDRRSNERLIVYQVVWWWNEGEPPLRPGLLVECFSGGVVLLTERAGTPAVGASLWPQPGRRTRWWSRPAVVTRVDVLPGGYRRVVAEYRVRATPSDGRGRLSPDRRRQRRDQQDRRRSARWQTEKPLAWRVFRGRRTRMSRVVERSLDGLVLATDPQDTPSEGTRLTPGDAATRRRFGFRSAVVRRVMTSEARTRLVVAEFEA